MSFHLSLSQLGKILNYTDETLRDFNADLAVLGITTDSRCLKTGQAFLALRGETFDGHEFGETAVKNGAIALIVERPISVKSAKKIPQFQVNNTLETYQQLARWWRDRFSIPVIAVTGSVGKTTTKELISAVLETRGTVHKTVANYNNEIGVPKTLLDLDESHDSAVIEMGMRARGEIALLAQITRPTIAVITNVGTAHIGRLGSEEAIAEAKCELLAQLPPTSTAILNHDNPLLLRTAARVWRGQTLTYGLEGGDLVGQWVAPDILRVEGMDLPVPLAGRHNALNYLAALGVAKVLGIDWHSLSEGLSVNLPKGRSKRYELLQDILLLDETYNAGLESMLAALDLLKETHGQRQIAVLGTMKELGDYASELHRRVGEKARKLGIDRLFVLVDDPTAMAIAEGARGLETECFATHEDLIQRLKEFITQGDRVLFKASNSVGLNRVVEAIVTYLNHRASI